MRETCLRGKVFQTQKLDPYPLVSFESDSSFVHMKTQAVNQAQSSLIHESVEMFESSVPRPKKQQSVPEVKIELPTFKLFC